VAARHSVTLFAADLGRQHSDARLIDEVGFKEVFVDALDVAHEDAVSEGGNGFHSPAMDATRNAS
jgi:hypothetical protein